MNALQITPHTRHADAFEEEAEIAMLKAKLTEVKKQVQNHFEQILDMVEIASDLPRTTARDLCAACASCRTKSRRLGNYAAELLANWKGSEG